MVEGRDQEPEQQGTRLILEKEINVPPPFDKDLANIELVPLSNDPTESYRLGVRATFQPQTVRIFAGETELLVGLEIYQAAIQFHFHRCEARYIDEDNTSLPTNQKTVRQKYAEKQEVSTKSTVGFEVTGVTSARSAKISGSASAAAARDTKAHHVRETEWSEERQIGALKVIAVNLAHIGRYQDELPLDGAVLDTQNWLEIVPSKSELSGVLARLTVREGWVKLFDAQPASPAGSLAKKMKDKLSTTSPESTFRRKAFEALLQHLVTEKLQSKDELDHATLAVHAVVCNLEQNLNQSISSTVFNDYVSVPSAPLERLLDTTTGSEATVLKQHGVASDVVLKLEQDFAAAKNKEDRFLILRMSPEDLINSLSAIRQGSESDFSLKLDGSEGAVPYKEPISITALLMIGVIERVGNRYVLSDQPDEATDDADFIMKAIREQELFKEISQVLEKETELSDGQLGGQLGIADQREAAKIGASGHRLIRWLRRVHEV